MSDTIRFAGAAAVLQPATLRMEKALAEDVTPAVVKYFKRLMAESRQECSGGHNSEALIDAFMERVTRVAKLNTDEIAALVKYLLDELQTSPEQFEGSLRPVFINRARIFAASRPAATKDDDVEVVLPDLSLFVHKMFVTVANAVASAQALFMSSSAGSKLNEYDRQRKRAQLVKAAVLRSLDIIQPPHAFGVKYFKSGQAERIQTDAKSVRSVRSTRESSDKKDKDKDRDKSGKDGRSKEKEKERSSKEKDKEQRSQHSSASARSSLKAMGFEEEEEEEEEEDDGRDDIAEGNEDEDERDGQGGDYDDDEEEEFDDQSARDSAIGNGLKLRNRKGPKQQRHDEMSVLSAQPYYRKARK